MAFFDDDTLRRIAQETQAQGEPVMLVGVSALGFNYLATRFGTNIASSNPMRIGTDVDFAAACVAFGISEIIARKAGPEPSRLAQRLRMVSGGAFGSFCSRVGTALGSR